MFGAVTAVQMMIAFGCSSSTACMSCISAHTQSLEKFILGEKKQNKTCFKKHIIYQKAEKHEILKSRRNYDSFALKVGLCKEQIQLSLNLQKHTS